MKGVRFKGGPLFLTPVRSIASVNFHVLYGQCKTTVICARFMSTRTLIHSVGSAIGGLAVDSRRHPINVRVCNEAARSVIRTTGVIRRTGPSIVSVGFKYPIGGITKGKTKTNVLEGVPLLLSVAHGIIGTIGIPIAIGAQLK